MRRREFLGVFGGAVVGTLASHTSPAQQPAMPVVGFLNSQSHETVGDRLRGFRQGLKDAGYVEGENVAIEYRFAENQMDRLPALVAELISRQVAVIAATGGPPSVLAAKAATTTIPIVFNVASDPVNLGLVTSLTRPGGNLTGNSFFNTELAAKRLELLRDLLPAVMRVAVLVNPASPANTETTLRDVEAAARTIGLQIQVLNASTGREIDLAFANLARERSDALFVANDGFFTSRRVQLAQLATFYKVPSTYAARDISEVGGLMSYGTNIADSFRRVGVYTGRILKGAKPADLPVEQSSKFELVINAQTARMLDITVPPSLLARADEVIE